MRAIVVVLFCTMLNFLSAQGQLLTDFTGAIKNSRGFPVANASIYILNTNKGTVSDEKGFFSFHNIREGRYTLQISAVGFATAELDIIISELDSAPFSISLVEVTKQLDAVLVTAQKTEEFLRHVPFSITSLSSRQVKQYRLWNINELTAIAPNLFLSNSGDGRNVTSIRGITTTSYDPAVATYVDGINQFGLDTYLPQLFDVERIEILRGPQGTLYGRNAMGGVINVITKQPENFTKSAFAEINIGNYDQERYCAGIRTPLIKNKLLLGMAWMYNRRDGFYKNEFTNSGYDKQRSFTGNYYLKFIANSNWSFTLNFKHRANRNNGAFPLVNGTEEALKHPYMLNQDAVAKMIDNTVNSSFSISYKGKKLNFTSQASYQSNLRYYDKPLDGDFSPIDGITVINDYGGGWNKVKVITQEIRFSSPGITTSSLKWVTGAYLFRQINPTRQAVHFGKDAALLGAPDTEFSTINTSKGKNYGIAFFGQATYSLADRFNIIAGLRYDFENRKYNVLGEYQKDSDPLPLFETRPDTSATANFNAFSPKVGLAYNLNSNSNVFAVYSRGFRTGGFTQLSTDPSQPPLYSFKPEHSSNFEVGIKNNLFNSRVYINTTFFYTKVTDVQVPTLILPDAITVTRNAGLLNSKGVELEISAIGVKGFQLDYNFGYTHAIYKNLKLSQYGTSVNLDGKKQIFTPATTSMLALQYSFNLSKNNDLRLIVRGEWANLGKQYFDLVNSISQDNYNLINIKFGISYKKLEVVIWGRNMENKKYISYAYDFGAVHLGDPKTYGVTISFRSGEK